MEEYKYYMTLPDRITPDFHETSDPIQSGKLIDAIGLHGNPDESVED